MTDRDTPEAALAAVLREAEDADVAEGHTPSCHEPWEYRIAGRLLAATPPGWCGHERTTRLFTELSDSYTEAEAEIARLRTRIAQLDSGLREAAGARHAIGHAGQEITGDIIAFDVCQRAGCVSARAALWAGK
jgi:hypothetical protein